MVLGTVGSQGGAIYSDAATNFIVNDVITNNAATEGGGGIDFAANSATSASSVLQTYLASNFAGGGGDGGAILSTATGYLQIVNDTIAMNTAGQHGGGVATEGIGANVHTDVLFATITGNLTGQGGGIYNAQNTTNGGTASTAIPVGLGDTIVAGNYAAPDPPVFPLPVGGYVNTLANGYNLFGLFSDTLTTPPAGANVPNPGSTGAGGIVGDNYIGSAPGIAPASTLSAGNGDQIIAPSSDYNVPPFVGGAGSYLSPPAYNGGPVLPGVSNAVTGNFFTEKPIVPEPAAPGVVDDGTVNAFVMNFFGGAAGTVIDQAGQHRPLTGPQPPPLPAAVDEGAFEVT
jgi:hypothetical protein